MPTYFTFWLISPRYIKYHQNQCRFDIDILYHSNKYHNVSVIELFKGNPYRYTSYVAMYVHLEGLHIHAQLLVLHQDVKTEKLSINTAATFPAGTSERVE